MQTSLIVTTFNRYNSLKKAIFSIQKQSIKPKEIIIIDDGSSDDTYKISNDFPKLRYIKKANDGISSARNLGIKKASYEWICFLDDDDEWDKEKLKEQIDFHKSNPHIKVSFTDEKWIRDGKRVNVPKKFQKNGDIFLKSLKYCFLAPSSFLAHKSIFEKVGLFDEDLKVCEDYDLWIRIMLHYEVGIVKNAFIIKHGGDESQLSLKYKSLDSFRVKSLIKIYKSTPNEYIKDEIINKLSLLMKVAKNHEDKNQQKHYERLLNLYKRN